MKGWGDPNGWASTGCTGCWRPAGMVKKGAQMGVLPGGTLRLQRRGQSASWVTTRQFCHMLSQTTRLERRGQGPHRVLDTLCRKLQSWCPFFLTVGPGIKQAAFRPYGALSPSVWTVPTVRPPPPGPFLLFSSSPPPTFARPAPALKRTSP